jgi:hypothetical protein
VWIRDSDGRWHATRLDGLSPWGDNGANPWTDTHMVTVWLRIIPPLDQRTAWIEISAPGDRPRSGPPYRSDRSNDHAKNGHWFPGARAGPMAQRHEQAASDDNRPTCRWTPTAGYLTSTGRPAPAPCHFI